MITKLKIISFLLSLSFFVAIAYVSLIAPKNDFHNFLIAVPKISGNGIPIKKLQEVNDSKVMLTYENMYGKSIKALQSNYNVVLKGTNDSYLLIMNYGITSGGFFNKEVFDYKNRVAVLNEKAAFDMFGALDAVGNDIQIDMTPYIVIGVINDNDTDSMNIFIPATCMAETAETVVACLSSGNGLTEEYVKNELKHIGIDEMKYDFVNLGQVLEVIKNNRYAAFEIALFGLLLLVIKKSAKSMGKNMKELERQYQEYYFMELIRAETKPLLKLTLLVIAVIGMMVMGFIVILNLFVKFLSWSSLKWTFSDININSFSACVAQIENLYLLSNALIIGFTIIFAVYIVAVWD